MKPPPDARVSVVSQINPRGTFPAGGWDARSGRRNDSRKENYAGGNQPGEPEADAPLGNLAFTDVNGYISQVVAWEAHLRIITGRDYYDVGLGVGQDDRIVFVRKKDAWLTRDRAAAVGIGLPQARLEVLPGKDGSPRGGRIWSGMGLPAGRQRPIVGPSGFSYAFAPVSVILRGRRRNGMRMLAAGPGNLKGKPGCPVSRSEIRHFWSWEALLECAAAEEISVRWRHPSGFRRRAPDMRAGEQDASGAADYFAERRVPPVAMDFLVSEGITLLTWGSGAGQPDGPKDDWRVDGDDLKDMEFYRVLDPFQAYQEIAQWVGGVLPGRGAPIVEITDSGVLAAKHGFDRWSFRKPPAGG
jgi:hypothetical protein